MGGVKWIQRGCCSTSKARSGQLITPHHIVNTPVFMPVGTQVNCKIASILDNLLNISRI